MSKNKTNEIYNNILNKLIKINENQWGRKAARINDNLQDLQNSIYNNKIIYKIKKEIDYKYTYKTHKDFNEYKVLYSTLGDNYIIDYDKNLFPGTSFVVYIKCIDLKECENIIKLKDSKMMKFLIKIFKDLRSPLDYIWRNLVKYETFNIEIKDDMDVYKYFRLTDEEIKLMEENT